MIIDIMKKFLVLLAIFCILGSAVAVSAADVYESHGAYDDIRYDESHGAYDDIRYDGDSDGYAGSNYQDDGGWAGSQYNETEEGLTDRPLIDPDYAHMEPGSNSTDNETGNAAGELVANETANITVNAATSQMPVTGNPILVLLAICAVLGGAAVIRRK